MTLSPDGALSGTPPQAGSSSFTLQATYKTKSGQNTYQVVSADLVVGLAPASLPQAKVAEAYAPYDFKTLLNVTGAPNYAVGEVSFKATNVPQGMTLSASGVLSGAPTTVSEGATFQVVASYKTKSGQQAYTLKVGEAVLEVTQIVSGSDHTCAVTTTGAAKCWGSNGNSQLGDGSNTSSTVPVQVVGLTAGVSSLSAGYYHTCALTTAGAAQCWGLGNTGQLGNGSTARTPVPVQVSGLTTGVSSLSAGAYHTCAVVSGTAKCWGTNSTGQLGNGLKTNSPVPVNVRPGT